MLAQIYLGAIYVGAAVTCVTVYDYRPKGATKQRRFAVATGDRPEDIVSTHGTKEVAVRAATKLAEQLGVELKVEC